MSKELLKYIRSHDYIYNFLREDSSHYIYLYKNNDYIKVLKKIAKERYKISYCDKLDRINDKINLINTLIDVFK